MNPPKKSSYYAFLVAVVAVATLFWGTINNMRSTKHRASTGRLSHRPSCQHPYLLEHTETGDRRSPCARMPILMRIWFVVLHTFTYFCPQIV